MLLNRQIQFTQKKQTAFIMIEKCNKDNKLSFTKTTLGLKFVSKETHRTIIRLIFKYSTTPKLNCNRQSMEIKSDSCKLPFIKTFMSGSPWRPDASSPKPISFFSTTKPLRIVAESLKKNSESHLFYQNLKGCKGKTPFSVF